MEPMTLDEAKLIADCNRRLPGRASTGAPEATVVLAAALRESEARVEAAEKRAANARREAFEQAAKVADEVARRSTTVAGEGTARIIARDIRALKPEAKAEATPATVVVHRCNADNGREVCTFEADHGGAHSWPPAFDARKASSNSRSSFRSTIATSPTCAQWSLPPSPPGAGREGPDPPQPVGPGDRVLGQGRREPDVGAAGVARR